MASPFLIALHSQLLGVLMTFAETIWYAGYATRTQLRGLTPLEEQQLAGLIMWIPAAPASSLVCVAGHHGQEENTESNMTAEHATTRNNRRPLKQMSDRYTIAPKEPCSSC